MKAAGDERIRARAYSIWEREGGPHGRDLQHWLQAEAELAREAKSGKRPAPSSKSASKASAEKAEATPAERARKTRVKNSRAKTPS